jgi:hypothetical protein
MMTTTTAIGAQPIDDASPEPDDLRLWSVTTIIGCLDKPALQWWSADQTANAALDNIDILPARIAKEGREEVFQWLRKARFRPPRNQLGAAKLGAACHSACEEFALTGTRPTRAHLAEIVAQHGGDNFDGLAAETDTLHQMVDQFDRWLQKFTPSYQAVETTVYNTTYGYAGTLDAFLTIDQVRFIADYKTSRKSHTGGKPTGPYPEVALQLSAYRHAEMAAVWTPRRMERFKRRYYLLSPTEQHAAVAVPDVDAGLVIHITPEHCDAFPVNCDTSIFESFLFVQEAARWANETSKHVIGRELLPPERT